MGIHTESYTPPQFLKTQRFCVFPTDPAYSAPDFEAVMASRAALRIWSASEWPEDSFTLEENRADLQLHVDDNNDHSAYGYMIFNPERTVCYGSVYVNPLDSLTSEYNWLDCEPDTGAFDARIEFWTRSEYPEIEREITALLIDWFKIEWKIRPLFTAREQMESRRAVYETLGLRKYAELAGRDDGGKLFLFAL